MSLRSPADDEKVVGEYRTPLVVIPAEAGIQGFIPCPAWIPAFAGMTDPGILRLRHKFIHLFSKEVTKTTKLRKFKNVNFRILRVLRALRGEQNVPT
jgi:hypothetical protein